MNTSIPLILKQNGINKLLVDLDIVLYRTASVVWELSGINDAVNIANDMLGGIQVNTGIQDMVLYISGDKNFRKQIYPEYKANRFKTERPPVLMPLVGWFETYYGAIKEDTVEADDLLGRNQTDKTAIVSIDKDLLMIPGWHYNFVKDELTFVSEFDAIYNFYTQLLVGDPADNIKGATGIGKAKAPKILDGCETEEELRNAVTPYFSCEEEMDMNAQVLWIQQKGRLRWNDTKQCES